MNRFNYLLLSIVVFTSTILFFSCEKEKNLPRLQFQSNFISNPITHFNVPNCDRLYSNTLLYNGDSLYHFGKLHNILLDSLLKVEFNIDDYLNNEYISSSLFGSKFNEYYLNGDFGAFAISLYENEIKHNINQAFQDSIISQEAKLFLNNIAINTINNNFNSQASFTELKNIDHNTTDYLFCSIVFSITEYSNCYWISNTNNSARWIQAVLAFDCLAGIGQTIKEAYDSYNNNWQYDADSILRNCGKAAAWRSTLGRFGL